MTRQDGFTLLETVVALVIMALGVTALSRLTATGLAASEQAERLAVATGLARSVLARTGVDQTLAVGEDAGAWDDGYRWRRTVRPMAQEFPADFVPLEVEVTVGRGPRDPTVTLTSFRLVERKP